MKKYFFIFAIICSCVSLSVIEKERKFLEENPNLTLNEAINYFGEIDDSIIVRKGKVMIWDNLNGKMTRMTAPPYDPLDSTQWFGKRLVQILFDTTNYQMVEYKYWDYTNPKDFEIFIKNKNR